jgi:hypothetical protein
MASNSLADILEKMRQGSITEKWGAVCAFDRERLNRVLQQQWLEQYDGTHYVPVFSGQMDLNESKTEYGVLNNILLGKPLLSFEPAALDNSRATLTLSILGGTFTAYERTTGVMYSYTITEAQGYTLKVRLDLSLVVGVVDRLGRVTLDLSRGTQFICDLAGPAASQQKLGQFFEQRFKALPPERQVYVLGMLNLKGGSDLTPERFMVLTQRAPGAELPGALNAADGAVVVLVKLRGSAMGGDIPSKDYFPYLIPDDEENGVRKYSATMVLAQEFISRSDEDKLELIHSLLFPGEKNVFVEHSRHTPYDMVSFGSLDPSKTSLTIEPAVHSLKAGGPPLSYRAYLDNVPVSGVVWSVKSLNTNYSSGTINPTSGVYQPVSAALITKEAVRNIVTATYTDPVSNQQHRVSALLLVTVEAMTLSPAYVPRRAGGMPVTFVATAISGSTLTWSTPEHGTLVANGNTAVYTPPASEQLPENFVVQAIEVRDASGETVKACVLLSKFAATMTIEPPFVGNVARSGTVQLSAVDAPSGLEQRWEVLGEGTVSDGVFTAPAAPSSPFSVVKCDIFAGDFLARTGYSIIKLRKFEAERGWTSLTRFSLSARRLDKVFANGYQQFPVEVRIETNGDRLTLDEEGSLTLFYADSNQAVYGIPRGQDGLEYDPVHPVQWGQTRIENRFSPFSGTIASAPRDEVIQPNYIYPFLVTRATQPTRFYAEFTVYDEKDKPTDETQRSDQHPGHENGIITVQPERPPTPVIGDYSLTRQRVAGGSGPGNEDTDDDFDWHLRTTDYWDLSYKRGGAMGVKFEAADVKGFNSIVQWESGYDNEQMFSYTGYGFNDPKVSNDQNVMRYDSMIKSSLPTKSVMEPGYALAEGQFRVGLFRLDNIRQDSYAQLYRMRNIPLGVILIDNEGNRHALAVGFPRDNRNKLYVDFLEE